MGAWVVGGSVLLCRWLVAVHQHRSNKRVLGREQLLVRLQTLVVREYGFGIGRETVNSKPVHDVALEAESTPLTRIQ